jgi:hypothetical protein
MLRGKVECNMTGTETVMETQAPAPGTIAGTGKPNLVAKRLKQLIGLHSAAIANAVDAFGHKVPGPGFSETAYLDHLDNFLSSVGRRMKRRAELESQLSVIDGKSKVPHYRDRARELLAHLLSTPRTCEVRECFRSAWAVKVKSSLKKIEETGYLVRKIQTTRQKATPGELEKSRAKLGELKARREKHRARLESLGYDGPQFRSLAAAAVDALGGPDRLESCVRAAWEAGSTWFEGAPGFTAIEAASERLATIEDQLKRVEPGTRQADSLASERTRARTELKLAEDAAAARRVAAAHFLVERVRSADGLAIKELVALAAAYPRAFPERTSQAFYRLRPTQEQMAGYVAVRLAEI